MNTLEMLRTDWSKQPISKVSKLPNKTIVLRIQKEMNKRYEEGEKVYFAHIYSHVNEKLKNPEWVSKVAAQREHYGRQRFELFCRGNECADQLATSALQLQEEPMTLFTQNSERFEISFNSRDPLDGPLSPQLRAHMRPIYLQKMRQHKSFQKMVPEVQQVDWTVSNKMFAKSRPTDHKTIDWITLARADRLQDRKAVYERNIDFITGNYVTTASAQHMKVGRDPVALTSTRNTMARDNADQVCPMQLSHPELQGTSAPLSTSTPWPRGMATRVLNSDSALLNSNDVDQEHESEMHVAQLLLGLSTGLTQEDAGSQGRVWQPQNPVPTPEPRNTQVPQEVIQRYQRVNADPFCERCKADGKQVQEDRVHILVECPYIEPKVKQLVEDLRSYLNTVVRDPVQCIPNWFMADKWEIGHCMTDLVPDMHTWNKAAGMCGYMPVAVVCWLDQLPLCDVASKVAARLNHMVMQATAKLLTDRWQYHRDIVKEKCQDLKAKSKRKRAPRKYR